MIHTERLWELHDFCTENMNMPRVGLCNSIPVEFQDCFEAIMNPSSDECIELDRNQESLIYWGSGLNPKNSFSIDRIAYSYSDRRQTLLLLFITLLEDEWYVRAHHIETKYFM